MMPTRCFYLYELGDIGLAVGPHGRREVKFARFASEIASGDMRPQVKT
jgi:hypothetical protein